jgi:hypothetical protein
VAAIVALGIRSASAAGLAAATLALAFTGFAVRAYRCRGPDRRACEACPQRTRAAPCSGFVPMVRREAAFARAAARLLRAVPPPAPPR